MTHPLERARNVGTVPSAQEAPLDVSVIITVVERPEPLAELYDEYAAVLREAGLRAEFLFVAHPYYGNLLGPVMELEASGEPVRTIETGQSIGETALLRLGLAHSRGRIVVTAPAYHQVEASAILALIAEVEQGADLVVARRWPRADSRFNRFQHRVLQLTAGRLAGNRLHDVACGVRAARREVLQDIPLYGDFARFLPLLAIYHGFEVREVASAQHPRDMPRRVYGAGVYLRRLIDVLGLFFLMRFTEKPLRFFGLLGSAMAGIGGVVLLVLLGQRIAGQALADRPLLLLAVLLITIGVQSIALGLVGEMIVHFSAYRRRGYRLRPQKSVDRDRG
jgi:hypothetical protein